jgi:hypothetical protein
MKERGTAARALDQIWEFCIDGEQNRGMIAHSQARISESALGQEPNVKGVVGILS